jgi:hypothetical protein
LWYNSEDVDKKYNANLGSLDKMPYYLNSNAFEIQSSDKETSENYDTTLSTHQSHVESGYAKFAPPFDVVANPNSGQEYGDHFFGGDKIAGPVEEPPNYSFDKLLCEPNYVCFHQD